MASPIPILAGAATQSRTTRPVSSTGEAGAFDAVLSGVFHTGHPADAPPSPDTNLPGAPIGDTTNPLPAGNDNALIAKRPAPALTLPATPAVNVARPPAETRDNAVSDSLIEATIPRSLSGPAPETLPATSDLAAPAIASPVAKSAKSTPGIHSRTSKPSPSEQTPPPGLALVAPDLVTQAAGNPLQALPPLSAPAIPASPAREIPVRKAGELTRSIPSEARDNETAASEHSAAAGPVATSNKVALKFDAVSGTAAPATLSGVQQAISVDIGASPIAQSGQDQAVLPTDHVAPADQIAPALVGVLKAADGTTSVTVHLQPVELGQVRIRIDQSTNGAARIDVTAERPETLQLLQRDEPRLQQVLDQAGVLSTGRTVNFQMAVSDQVGPTAARPDSMEAGSGSFGQGQSGGAWRQNEDSAGGSAGNPRSDQEQSRMRWFRAGLDITA